MTLDRFAVVVPARDEAANITKCVESILRSAAAAGLAHDRFELVVVADSCTDATAAIARRAVGGLGVVVEARAGSVGQARAIGTSRALARWVARPSTVWTVHTDADSVVPEGWLHHQRRVAEVGFAAVAGVVEVASFAEHGARTARRHHRKYSAAGDDHPHVHGANLGVRADAYRAVGGWSAIASGEDHALWNAVRRAGYPTLSTRSIHVVTSGRRVGRAPDGFAAHLRSLGEAV